MGDRANAGIETSGGLIGSQCFRAGVAHAILNGFPEVPGNEGFVQPKNDANVAELVDALDLGSSGVTREGSSPSFRTRGFEDEGFVNVDRSA